MSAGFDHIAKNYDEDFTYSTIGRLQRERVWDYFNAHLDNTHLNILEVNCGTGEDAVWLAKKGHQVLATDSSTKMVNTAQIKAGEKKLSSKITCEILDLTQVKDYPDNRQFDLVWSNFGGFNCLSPEDLKEAFAGLAKCLKPGGKIMAVVMPKFCLWETFYFMMKGQFSEAFRRKKKVPEKVVLGDVIVPTWYYSPKDIRSLSSASFFEINIRAVGFFIPPSYTETFFRKHLKTLKFLNGLENKLNFKSFAAWSDHFIIELKMRS